MLNPRRILFIRTDRLGETVLNIPAIQHLKQHWPAAQLIVCTQQALIPLLQPLKQVDAFIACDVFMQGPWLWAALKLAQRLKQEACDVAIISNAHKITHLAVKLAGIPVRLGYARKAAWALTHTIADVKARAVKHEIAYNLDLVRHLTGQTESAASLDLPVTAASREAVAALFAQQGFRLASSDTYWVLVHPWTSNPLKQWPTDCFNSLIQELLKQPKVHVALIGTEDNKLRAQTQFAHTAQNFLDLTGRLTLALLPALMQQARVLVSNDSGPVHIASAVGTSVIALFGDQDPGSNPTRWGPWGARHRVFHGKLNQISPTAVLDAVMPYVSP